MRKISAYLLLAILLFSICSSVQASERDKAQIREIIRREVSLRMDWVDITIAQDWAFVDVAQKGKDGSWEMATSVLLRKRNSRWVLLTQGDVHSDLWQQYYRQMSPAVKKAHDKWDSGHY